MGVAVWIGSALSAFAVARIIPAGRLTGWAPEVAVSTAAALLCGVTATALDFGGWREPDWRAAVFALFGSLAGIALYRTARLARLHP